LFGNIDNILSVNQAFLDDLEKISPNEHQMVGRIGDVALKHVCAILQTLPLSVTFCSSKNSEHSIVTNNTIPIEKKRN
jgi:hypothetical protein